MIPVLRHTLGGRIISSRLPLLGTSTVISRVASQFLLFVIITSPASVHAAGVVLDGREWRQLTETVNFTWNEVATVCPANGGACNGSLGSVDFSGWNWATALEVGDHLFRSYIPAFPSSFTEEFTEIGSSWGPAFFSDFEPTLSATGTDFAFQNVLGLSATIRSAPDFAYAPTILNREEDTLQDFDPLIFPDIANIGMGRNTDEPSAYFGVWLYRPVPIPPAIVLLGSVIFALFLRRRAY